MRTLALNQGAFNSGTYFHGARGEGWRAWPGILRAKNTGTGNATVTLRSAVTQEIIATIALTGAQGLSSGVITIPQAYTMDIAEDLAPINVSVVIDGDTGDAVGGRAELSGGFDDGFDQGFG